MGAEFSLSADVNLVQTGGYQVTENTHKKNECWNLPQYHQRNIRCVRNMYAEDLREAKTGRICYRFCL